MLLVFTLIILAASLMYFVEHDAQPDKFSSIPETMWWSVATLTTARYGDVYPVTAIGKTLTACISILASACSRFRRVSWVPAFQKSSSVRSSSVFAVRIVEKKFDGSQILLWAAINTSFLNHVAYCNIATLNNG
jgi:hypothetical protein